MTSLIGFVNHVNGCIRVVSLIWIECAINTKLRAERRKRGFTLLGFILLSHRDAPC